MAIDLDQPLDLTSMSLEQAEMLSDMQGNILKPHGRDHSVCYLLAFQSGDALRTFLERASRAVTSALEQLSVRRRLSKGRAKPGRNLATLSLSSAGYVLLGLPDSSIPGDLAFRAGLKARRHVLADPKPDEWDPVYGKEIHALLTIAGDDPISVRQDAEALLSGSGQSVSVIREKGSIWRNKDGRSLEHFGFVDGLTRTEVATDGGALDPGSTLYPLGIALSPCPGGIEGISFGSYLVYRKLEQDVRGFARSNEELSTLLGLQGAARDRAPAMSMGRFKDGTPLVLSGTPNTKTLEPFDYSKDSDGSKCPFHAHIRKLNPRDSSLVGAGIDARVVLRRGVTYGSRARAPDVATPVEELPTSGVGLLFMTYQANIPRQFEYLQAQFANGRDNPAGSGPDVIAGQSHRLPQRWPATWGVSQSSRGYLFKQHIRMLGGEYFFTPSITFLRAP